MSYRWDEHVDLTEGGAWWEWAIAVLILTVVLGTALLVGLERQDAARRDEQVRADCAQVAVPEYVDACVREVTR